ncbi:MAG: MarC family protein [Cyanobacteria bacterium P01_F01_bin.53]
MELLIASATGTFLALFPITNPFGVVPTFYSLTGNSTPTRRSHQARQVCINVVIVLTTALIVGRFILSFFGLSIGVLQIAGGLLLAQTSWRMVSAPECSVSTEPHRKTTQDDITLIPLAIPLISGPGAIGMVIGLATQRSHFMSYAGSLLGILGIGGLLYLCLTLGKPVVRILGKPGLRAFTQILGFFILAISIQLVTSGAFSLIQDFISSLAA